MMKLDEAKEACESVAMWMESRYMLQSADVPIQRWDAPREEKGFFTVFAMNVVMDGDGFEALAEQKPEDVNAFIETLCELGAKKTSTYVQQIVTRIKAGEHPGGYEFYSKYYDLFRKEKVWIKLFKYLGWPTYEKYVAKSQAIHAAGENIFDPKQWQGELPSA